MQVTTLLNIDSINSFIGYEKKCCFNHFVLFFVFLKFFVEFHLPRLAGTENLLGFVFFFRPFSKILFTFTAFSAGSCERVGVSGGKQCANSSHDLQLFRMKISNISTLEKNGGTKNQKTTKGHKHF